MSRIRLLPQAEWGRHTRRFCAPGQLAWLVILSGAKSKDAAKKTDDFATGFPTSLGVTALALSVLLSSVIVFSMSTIRFVILIVFLAAVSVRAESPADQAVLAAIKSPETSVVHLWAPWCSNCQAELKSGGWTKIIKENPQVKFYFVSVWNDGQDGRALLHKFGLSDQPNVTILADPGPRRGDGKIKQFVGLPLSWIPTTWIYKGGDLRYALNYGEVRFPVLQQFLTDSQSEWSHKGEPSIE